MGLLLVSGVALSAALAEILQQPKKSRMQSAPEGHPPQSVTNGIGRDSNSSAYLMLGISIWFCTDTSNSARTPPDRGPQVLGRCLGSDGRYIMPKKSPRQRMISVSQLSHLILIMLCTYPKCHKCPVMAPVVGYVETVREGSWGREEAAR